MKKSIEDPVITSTVSVDLLIPESRNQLFSVIPTLPDNRLIYLLISLPYPELVLLQTTSNSILKEPKAAMPAPMSLLISNELLLFGSISSVPRTCTLRDEFLPLASITLRALLG